MSQTGPKKRRFLTVPKNTRKLAYGTLLLLVAGAGYLIYRGQRARHPSATNQPASTTASAKERAVPKPVASVVEGKDAATGLVAEGNWLVVRDNCTACHSSKLILQAKLSRENWLGKIRWMQRTQKLWDLGSNEPLILDYLAKHYAPAQNPGRRPPLKDIQWYVLTE